jgi:hypothetical protein
MPKQEPKKPRQPKSKRLNLNTKAKWEALLKEVKKEQVPIGVLRYITVNLKDGTSVDVNIAEMLEEGADPAVVEDSAERFVCLEAQGVEEEEHAMWTDQHESRLFIALLSIKGNWHSSSVAAYAANNLGERAVALMSKQVGVVCCPKKTKAASQG